MKSDLKRIFGAFGDAHAYAWAGARSPALAYEVSAAAVPWRSTTVTS